MGWTASSPGIAMCQDQEGDGGVTGEEGGYQLTG